jgi:hypothetical protein
MNAAMDEAVSPTAPSTYMERRALAQKFFLRTQTWNLVESPPLPCGCPTCAETTEKSIVIFRP